MSMINEWLDQESIEHLKNSPLLSTLNNIDKETLKLILAQHAYYSAGFVKYLSLLLCKIDNEKYLQKLMGNLKEELGVEDSNKIPHSELYNNCLAAIGVDINEYSPFEETLKLKEEMQLYCNSTDPLDGLAALCFGAEAIVPIIYTPIYNSLVHHGFDASDIEFFRLHICEDEAHALEMFDIIKEIVGDDVGKKAYVKNIGKRLIKRRCEMFQRIYEESLKNRERYNIRKEFYTSKDFGNIPSKLSPNIYKTLKHENVLGVTNENNMFSQERRHKVNIVDLPAKTISMTLGYLEQGQNTRPHKHNYETVIYIVEGEGYSNIESEKVEWKKGDAIYIPNWSLHNHVNTGDEECIYVACENAPLLQNIGEIAIREEMY